MSVAARFRALARYNVLTPIAVLAALAVTSVAAQTLTIDNPKTTGVDLPGFAGGPYNALINNSSISNTTGNTAVDSNAPVLFVTNSANGTVTGDDAHAFWFGSTFGTFTNNGVISNSGNNGSALRFQAAAESFINNRQITSTADDSVVSFGFTLASFLNSTGATISTTSSHAVFDADGRVTTFTNAGTMSNSANGDPTVVFQDGFDTFRNLAGGSISNTLDSAVVARGTKSGTFSNAGTISGNRWEVVNFEKGITSFVNEAGGRIVNTNDGTEPGGSAVGFQTDTGTGGIVDSFANYGELIGGTGAAGDQGPTVGFHSDDSGNAPATNVASQVGTFFNAGSITGPGTGVNFRGGVGTFNNASGGKISSSAQTGVNSNGNIGTFFNAGTITSATSDAVWVSGTVSSFTNTGTLSGWWGVNLDGGATSVTNSGTIASTSGASSGLRVAGAGGTTVTNSGTITGEVGIGLNSGGAGNTVINSGKIVGTNGPAITFDWGAGSDDTLRILTGSQLLGRVEFGGGADTFDFSGFRGTTVVEVRGLESTVAGSNTFVSALDNSGDGVIGIFDQSGATTVGGTVTTEVVGAIQGAVGGALDGIGTFAPATQPSAYVAPARLGGAAGAAEQAVLTELDTTRLNGTEVWGQVFGGGSRDEAPVPLAHVYGGIVAGTHTQLNSNTRLGGLLGVVGSNYDVGGAQKINTQLGVLGVYGETDLGSVVIDYALIGGGAGHTSSRDVVVLGSLETLRANFSSWFVSPSLGVTLPLLSDDGTTVNVAASASYAFGGVSGYTETGNTLSIAVGSVPIGVFDGRLELNGTKLVGATEHGDITLRGKIGVLVQANVGGSNVPVTFSGGVLSATSSFTTAGNTSFGGYAGAGLSADIAHNLKLDVSGDALLRNDGLAAIGGKVGLTGSF